MTDESRVLELVLKARDLAGREVGKLGTQLGAVDQKASGATGRLSGLGKMAGAVALGGVALLVGGLIGAGRAAAEEEKGIARLDAALQANIPSWNGNREAIEALISKRERLAFSDDDLRGSMALLVASTKDVTKAQDLQAIAMDLARLKGVSLEAATVAVAKASQGSTRELKALGIEIDDNASAADNLARVQQAAAGQAEKYAGTTAGKFETLSNKIGDVIEDVGVALLPLFSELADVAIDVVVPALVKIAGGIGWIITQIHDFAKAVGMIKPAKAVGKGLTSGNPTSINPTNIGAGAGQTALAAGGFAPIGASGFVGEEGPERFRLTDRGLFVEPTRSAPGGGSPVELRVMLDGREIARVVDEHLFYQARRAAPSALNG